MRSLATRGAESEISRALPDAIAACKVAGFELIVVETSGIGQGDAAVVPHVDVSLYVMTPEFGAPSQLEKIDMLDFADFVAINKFDRKGARRRAARCAQAVSAQPRAFQAAAGRNAGVRHHRGALQRRRRHRAVSGARGASCEAGPEAGAGKLPVAATKHSTRQHAIVPSARVRYLAEIAETVRGYYGWAKEQAKIARERQQLRAAKAMLASSPTSDRLSSSSPRKRGSSEQAKTPDSHLRGNDGAGEAIDRLIADRDATLDPRAKKLLEMWPKTKAAYTGDEYVVKIRGKEIRSALTTISLSGTHIPKVALPRYEDDGEILRWQLTENVPGSFPYAAGVFAFKRENEDPTRMFAGEGDAFRTNKRFHMLADGMPAKRLSTAFDSVTLYGNDPDLRPDIYGKVGNSGVSDRHARRHEGALLGLRPHRAEQLGVDDHQRPGADDPGDVPEHRDRPAAREIQGRQQARPDRRRGAEDQGVGAVHGARHGAGRHPQGRPGAEHLHLLHRVQPQGDGRHPGILRPARRQELLLGVDLRLSHRRGRREPDLAARVHAVQRLHLRRGVSRARHAHRRLRAEPVVLLQLRDGPRVRGDRPRRAAHLGGGDARALRRQRALAEAQVPFADERRAACTRRRSRSTTSAPRCRR